MSTVSSENTSSGRPTETPQKGDRYLFGNLESLAKNQEKLQEVNWGYDQPEGIVLASLGCRHQLGSEELVMADDLWSGLLRHRNDVDGRIPV